MIMVPRILDNVLLSFAREINNFYGIPESFMEQRILRSHFQAKVRITFEKHYMGTAVLAFSHIMGLPHSRNMIIQNVHFLKNVNSITKKSWVRYLYAG